jgi:hypothetical protein
LFLIFTAVSSAQSKDEKKYKERAAEVQQEVWGTTNAAFEVKQVPVSYDNESAVIIARSFYHSALRKGKGYIKATYMFLTVNRERIKINDKNSLIKYSTLDYIKQAKQKKPGGLFLKLSNSLSTYIGVKVIKPNGDVKITPTDDEVLTKNESVNKEGKLAVADLQIGDILDYYVCIEEKVEMHNEPFSDKADPMMFSLGDEYPILNYNIKYVLDNDCGVDILNINGAKPMNKTTNENKDIVLELMEKDLPKLNNTVWISAPRQVPYLLVRYGYLGNGCVAKAGEIQYGPFTEKYEDDLKDNVLHFRLSRSSTSTDKKRMEDYFGGKDEIKKLPVDSIVNYLYNYYRWLSYGGFLNMDVTNERNFKAMPLFLFVLNIRELLNDNDIHNDYVLVSNRFSRRLNEVFDLNDFETFIKIKSDGKFGWICLNDFFQDAGKLAPNYEGEKALIINPAGNSKSVFAKMETSVVLPVSSAKENVSSENLKLNFNTDNPQTVTIQRTCIKTGSMKLADQKKLLLAEDIDASLASLVKMPRRVDFYNEDKKLADKAAEIQAAMKIERIKQKDRFKEDIKARYDQEPKELISYKINNIGLSYSKPSFEYNETFTIDGLVKKAGNNYVFEVGRLMGNYKKIEEKERIRTLDVYMPAARTLTYSFSITIPDGYIAKGIEELNKKIENDVASFVSSASSNNNIINITITNTYNNNFEPAINWPKLLTIIDAAADFTNAKLLMEKIK